MQSFNFAPWVGPQLAAYLTSCATVRAEWAYIWLDLEGNVQRSWDRPHGPEAQGCYAELVPQAIWQAQDDELRERIVNLGHLPQVDVPPGIEEAEWANMWE